MFTNFTLTISCGMWGLRPLPTWGVVMKVRCGNANSLKKMGQQFCGTFDRIVVSHCSKDNSFMNLVRGLSGVNYLISPAFILA